MNRRQPADRVVGSGRASSSSGSGGRSRRSWTPLAFAPPLDAAGLLAFFAARAVPGVEEVDGATYRRSVRLAARPGGRRAGRRGRRRGLAAGGRRSARLRRGGALLPRRSLDARRRPGRDRRRTGARPTAAATLVAATPGRRVPGLRRRRRDRDPRRARPAGLGRRRPHAGGAAGRALRRAARRAGRRRHAPLPGAGGARRARPGGRCRCRAPAGASLVALAAALADGLDPRDRAAFLALPGIGPWTADYVAMRCGDPDVLLETDLGVRRGLARARRPRRLDATPSAGGRGAPTPSSTCGALA